MRFIRLAFLFAAGFLLTPSGLGAQQPTPGQVQQALQNPDVVTQLRSRLLSSGLSSEQVRARLRAAGYAETLLDEYLPGGSANADSVPSTDAMNALVRLGLIESTAQDTQRPVPPVVTETRSNIFGLDVFRSSTSRFDPMTAGPVDANYRVGPRDVLALILTGGIEASHTLEVTPEGYVVIPQVGQVFIANLTLDQIRSVLFSRLRRVYSNIGEGPNAGTTMSVSVARVRANQVFVIGEAAVPGSYQVSSAGSMLTALYAAGGPSNNGSMRAVELRRSGRTVGTLDLYDYLVHGDASRDNRLESGDIVFIPFHSKRVALRGEVGRSAIFELREGETLRELVRFAGGLAPTASSHRVQIRRVLPPQARTDGVDRVVLDIPASQLIGGTVPAFPLENGDQVQVFGISDVERNQVVIAGHVWAPGELGLGPNMRLSDAIRAAGGVRPGVFTDQVLVTRVQSGESPLQLRTQFIDTTGALISDLLLEEGDHIRVFARSEFAEDRFVMVSGAVRSGGRIAFREGMTLRDAVLLAGGPSEAAHLREAELARITTTSTGGIETRTERVPLDSSYVFQRGSDGSYSGPPGVTLPEIRSPEIPLQPYDQVLILRRPDFDLVRQVTITGEVAFPGTYALRTRDERLSDVLIRAGGITSQGYASGAALVRKADSIGRINVDVGRALKDVRSRDNLVIVQGDSIHVPRHSPVVKVRGAVSSPASIAHFRGRDMRYYVAAAGGTLHNGDLGRAYVIQPNGTRELYRNRWGPIPNSIPTPLPGSEIVVPVKPEERTSLSDRLTPVVQGVSALATLLLVLSRL